MIEIPFSIGKKMVLKKRPIERKKKNGEKIIVIEPHPDDFALSASGYILNALSRGGSATIFNVFSKMPITTFPWKKKIKLTEKGYEELRILESRVAIEKYLEEKFESMYLASPTLSEKIGTFPEKYSQKKLINTISGALKKKILDEKFTTVLCPMAVQGHIAHSISFDAALEAFKDSKLKAKLIVYEDMPYARNQADYVKRLKQIKKKISFTQIHIDVERYLDIMADLISVYKSQFDDVDRDQILAIIREDFRATASGIRNKSHKEFLQRYLEIKKTI